MTKYKSQVEVVASEQTSEEERRFIAAFELFLAELVRPQHDRGKENNEIPETHRETIHRTGPL